MTPVELRSLLDAVRDGAVPVDAAHAHLLATLREQPFTDLGFARVDHHRAIRQGFPEVILGLGKTAAQIAAIAAEIAATGQPLLVTRADSAAWEAVRHAIPDAEYHSEARAITVGRVEPAGSGTVAILSAGTSDVPVAEEAAVTAQIMGNRVERVYDVGVAGLHRLLHVRPTLERARVIVVAAGMEGALPSVVAGMVSVPVIAVPTSVGYGPASAGSPPCWRCSIPAPAVSPSSTSTTGSAPDASPV